MGVSTFMNLLIFRADGVTPVGGNPITECETVKIRSTLGWNGECLIQGGRFFVRTPDGVEHVAADPVPCLGAATVNTGGCTIGQSTSISTTETIGDVSYTVQPQDVVGDQGMFSAVWEDGIVHIVNHPPQGGSRSLTLTVEPCPD